MGGGSSVPATTTSTQYVNQTPWMNPTYTALMLGSSGSPGPVTSLLNYDKQMMSAYQDMINKGITPATIMQSGIYNPTMHPGAVPVGDAITTTAPTQDVGKAAGGEVQGYADGGIAALLSRLNAEQGRR